MTSPDTPGSNARYPIPAVVVAALTVVLLALYPAIWNSDQGIRRVCLTILILGLVAFGLAIVISIAKWAQDLGNTLAERRAMEIRSEALAELDGVTETEWDALVHRLYVDPDRRYSA